MAHQHRPYPLRMPDEMREYLQMEADKNNRSLHAEVLVRLQSTLPETISIPKESFSRPSGSRTFSQKQSLKLSDKNIKPEKNDAQLKGLLARMMEILDAVDQDEAREIVEENEAYESRAELDEKTEQSNGSESADERYKDNSEWGRFK